MITVTIAAIPLGVSFALFIVFFFAICIEGTEKPWMALFAISSSVLIYFALYGALVTAGAI